MRSRLVRGIAAVAVAVAMILGVAAPPARAADDDIKGYTDIAVGILSSLISKLEDKNMGPAEVLDLIRELSGAVDGVKVDVVSRLDAEVVARLQGQVDAALSKVDLLSNPFFAAVATNDAINTAREARRMINVVSADNDVDAVGRAMITAYTIVIVGRERLGATEASRKQTIADYQQALLELIGRMAPRCTPTADGKVGTYYYTCEYNGKTVRGELGVGGCRIDGEPLTLGCTSTIVEEQVRHRVMEGTAARLANAALFQIFLGNL